MKAGLGMMGLICCMFVQISPLLYLAPCSMHMNMLYNPFQRRVCMHSRHTLQILQLAIIHSPPLNPDPVGTYWCSTARASFMCMISIYANKSTCNTKHYTYNYIATVNSLARGFPAFPYTFLYIVRVTLVREAKEGEREFGHCFSF